MFNPQSSLSEASPSYSLESEKEKRNLQKELIGKFAATLVEPNDTVIIDSGSTTEHLAHYIPGGMPMTALCYSMNILNELIDRIGELANLQKIGADTQIEAHADDADHGWDAPDKIVHGIVDGFDSI